VQREEESISCEHGMGLRWVTVLGEQLCLQHISISHVCVVCLVLA
jgi:hypothetical protein